MCVYSRKAVMCVCSRMAVMCVCECVQVCLQVYVQCCVSSMCVYVCPTSKHIYMYSINICQ